MEEIRPGSGNPPKHGIAVPASELLAKRLPEFIWQEKLTTAFHGQGRWEQIGVSRRAHHGVAEELPLMALTIGSTAPEAPVLGLFAGVHGLERIGSQVCLALLQSLSELLLWDVFIQYALKHIRIVAIPLINPLGMMHLSRSNPNGVDLMRNAPIEGENKVTFMVGGHRISNRLPWYRGENGLEPENQALLAFCKREFFQSKRVITVDFHSGFGLQDQLWFPYASSLRPFEHLPQLFALKEVLDRTYPHHIYKIEPQAKNYTTHGDMWDYIYKLYRDQNPGVFLPLALEMGSWNWVRKNPLQVFNPLGAFNPVKPHRQKRTLRRHLTLFDFFIRSLMSPSFWSDLNEEQTHRHFERAKDHWGI